MNNDLQQRLSTVIRDALRRADYKPGKRVDPVAVILANGADIYYGPYDPETSLGAFLEGPICDIVTLSEKLKSRSNRFARRHAGLHELSHLLLKRAGVTTDAVSCYMPSHLARARSEILAVQVHGMLAIRNAQACEFLRRHPNGDAMDLATFCDTTYDIAMLWLVTAPSWASEDEPRPDASKLAAILARSKSRIEIIGLDALPEYVRRDPKVICDPLFESEALKTLKTIEMLVTLGPGVGEAVAAIIAKEAAIDLRIHFAQLPLEVPMAVLAAIAQLPVSQAAIARGIFFTKLRHLDRAIEAVSNVPWDGAKDEAHGLCVLARCEKLGNASPRGDAESARLYRRALLAYPRCNEALGGLVKYEIGRGDFDRAREYVVRISDFRRYYYAGKTLAAQGRDEEAIKLYETSVWTRSHAYWKKSARCLAQLYAKAGRDADARRTYADLLESYPYDVEALHDLTEHLIAHGESKEAVEQILGLTHSPGFQPWCLTTLARLFETVHHGSFARELSFRAAILNNLAWNEGPFG